MAIILFQTKGLRVGLYIVGFLIVVNSFVIQIYLPSTILPNPNETSEIDIKPFLKVRSNEDSNNRNLREKYGKL